MPPDAAANDSLMKKVLVLCTGNSCRSQMAEGYLRAFADNRSMIYSAGIEAHGVNPRAVAAMMEDGVNISGHTSNKVEDYDSVDFDFVITVCDNAQELCPIFPGKAKKFHHNFPDPAIISGTEEQIMTQFRAVRDQIKEYSRKFVLQHL